MTSNEYRVGVVGALIDFDECGEKTENGWTINHKKPTSIGGNDEDYNLRTMHWENNNAKGKKYKDNNDEVVYERTLVYKSETDCNDSSSTRMHFTNNEAKNE